MVKYKPEELKYKIDELLEFMEKHNFYSDYDSEGLGILEEDEEDKDIIVDGDEIISILLPRTEDEYEDFTVNKLYDLIMTASNGEIIENYKFVSKKKVLIRVQSMDYDKLDVIDNYHGFDKFEHSVSYKGIDYSIDIISGITEFGVRVVMDNDYSKYTPPILDEFFVSISSTVDIKDEISEEIFNAYIFEVYSTYGVEFDISPRPDKDFWEWDEEEEIPSLPNLRELKLGHGLSELYSLFNSTISITNPEAQILYFSKVIEYVSQTVIKKELINNTMNKLSTPEALTPNADFVMELESIFDKNKTYKKDMEAYNITISTCCDIFSIKKHAPSYLKKVCKIDISSDKQQLSDAYTELSKSISDTRNQIAHAKTNYNMKGLECPQEDLQQFSRMMKNISEQVVRWFARQSEDSRIVG